MALTQFLPMDSYYHGILAATEAETDVAFRLIQSTKQAVSVRWIMHVREKIGFAISPCTEGKMKCKLKFKRISIASSHTLTRKYFGQCATTYTRKCRKK